jgi:hypothetical protein
MALESPNTARNYLHQLNIYWKRNLHEKYATIDDWVNQVGKEQESSDINLWRKWASDLEAFVNAYVSRLTGRPLVEAARTFWSRPSPTT